MKTIVEIEWDEPQLQEWLCADNIAIALHAYCTNTKFKVRELKSLEQINKELFGESKEFTVDDIKFLKSVTGSQPVEKK